MIIRKIGSGIDQPIGSAGALVASSWRRRRARARRRPVLMQTSARLLPNALTILALCAGLTAIRDAIAGRWQNAVIAVLVAAVLDGLDGRIARLLKAQSRFGAELDSLADIASFGIAPALIIYLSALSGLGPFGWAAALIYAVCSALRLARFNATLDTPGPTWSKRFSVGVPAPAAACLALTPLVAGFEMDLTGPVTGPLVALWLVTVAGLMISQIPTLSSKSIRLAPRMFAPALLAISVVGAVFASAPWWTFLMLSVMYLGFIPVTIAWSRRMIAESATSAEVLYE